MEDIGRAEIRNFSLRVEIFLKTRREISPLQAKLKLSSYLRIFQRFPGKSSKRPKTAQVCPNRAGDLQEISEEYRRLPKTYEKDPKMF